MTSPDDLNENVAKAIAIQVTAEIDKVGDRLGETLVKQFSDLESNIFKRLEDKLIKKLKDSVEKGIAELAAECNKKLQQQADEIEGLKFEMAELRDEINTLKKDTIDLQDEQDLLFLSHDNTEQDAKRQNIRMTGVQIASNESLDNVTDKVVQIFNEGGVSIVKRDINQISISGKPSTRDSQTTQQVIVRFSNWSARMRANKFNNKNRQKTKVRVQADLTRHRFQLLKSTQSYIKQKMSAAHGRERNVNDNNKCFAFANAESDLVLRLGDGGFRKFKDNEEAKKLVDRFFNM